MNMAANALSLRQLAKVLGVSQPFLSQIRAGKRPLPDALRVKVERLGAHELLISDKQLTVPASFESGVGRQGFEPWTPGLKVRCSASLS